MKIRKRQKKERGAALLLAIFSLVLVSTVALAMLFASDTETAISVNYRDKQVATYAALSGLQEARDRIHPLTGDLGAKGLNIVPTALPTAANHGVLYIINPASGETVAPWDPTNQYFDTELCHEHILGLSGTDGVPCPTNQIPSGSGWYQVYDNSQHATGWQVKDSSGNAIPLSYKWVRVTLKADNMTPVVVGTGNGSQVCWAPPRERQLVAGYGNDCGPRKDKVTNIAVINPGSGYDPNVPPTVTITGGGGSGATATADVGQNAQGVTSVHLTNSGTGYSSAPNVSVVPVDGNGAGAIVTAQIGSPVSSVSLTNNGTPPCYMSGAVLQPMFDSTYGSGATGSIALTAGTRCVYSFSVTGNCNGGGSVKDGTVKVTGSSGTFTGSFTVNNHSVVAGSAAVTNPGNYTNGVPAMTFTNNGSCDSTQFAIVPVYGYQADLSSFHLTNGGLYSNPPTVSIGGAPAAGGSGTTSGTTTLTGGNAGQLTGLTLVANGSGYTANPTLIIDPPPHGGAQATGWASIAPDVIVMDVKVTNGGSGYTSPPTVAIGPPSGVGGTQATAVATLGSGGASYGAVYLITAMAQTKTGARAITQMEAGVNFSKFTMALGGALTLAGPSPTFSSPNSNNLVMNGNDNPTSVTARPGCNTNPLPSRPSIGVFDDPTNPTNPTALSTVLNSLGKPQNYIGVNSAPDVENAYGSLGGLSVDGLNAFVQSVQAHATNIYNNCPTSNPCSNIALGSANNWAVDYVNGDLDMGPETGYGILLVNGNLNIHGNFQWNGLVLAIGTGNITMSGGGNLSVNGAVFAANTQAGSPPGTAIGSPNVAWNGGGTNYLQYNHCWADDLLASIPYTPPLSPNALQVISLRTLEY